MPLQNVPMGLRERTRKEMRDELYKGAAAEEAFEEYKLHPDTKKAFEDNLSPTAAVFTPKGGKRTRRHGKKSKSRRRPVKKSKSRRRHVKKSKSRRIPKHKTMRK
jgi:hypothetical protein